MPVFPFFLDHSHQHRNLPSFLPFYNSFRNSFDYLSSFTFCLTSLLSFPANLLKRLWVFPTPSSSSLLSDFASTQDSTHHSGEMPLLGSIVTSILLHLRVLSPYSPYRNDQQCCIWLILPWNIFFIITDFWKFFFLSFSSFLFSFFLFFSLFFLFSPPSLLLPNFLPRSFLPPSLPLPFPSSFPPSSFLPSCLLPFLFFLFLSFFKIRLSVHCHLLVCLFFCFFLSCHLLFNFLCSCFVTPLAWALLRLVSPGSRLTVGLWLWPPSLYWQSSHLQLFLIAKLLYQIFFSISPSQCLVNTSVCWLDLLHMLPPSLPLSMCLFTFPFSVGSR